MRLRIFANGNDTTELEAELRDRLELLGAPDALVVASADEPAAADALVVYLGQRDASRRAPTEQVEPWLASPRAVIPVCDEPPSFPAEIAEQPATLRYWNALFRKVGQVPWVERLVDELVAAVVLPRRRRVFLSYLRRESTGVVQQLRARLERRGHEVFVDEFEVPIGADVQLSIYRGILDADLFVLFASPSCLQSQWVRKEIAGARAGDVGVLAVFWPDDEATPNQLRGSLSDYQVHALSLGALVGDPARADEQVLTPEALDQLELRISTARTTAIAQRLNNLVPGVRTLLERDGWAVRAGQRLGDLYVSRADELGFVRVLPCTPNPRILYDAAAAASPEVSFCACYYGEPAPRNVEVVALRWLAFAERSDARLPKRFMLWDWVVDVEGALS